MSIVRHETLLYSDHCTHPVTCTTAYCSPSCDGPSVFRCLGRTVWVAVRGSIATFPRRIRMMKPRRVPMHVRIVAEAREMNWTTFKNTKAISHSHWWPSFLTVPAETQKLQLPYTLWFNYIWKNVAVQTHLRMGLTRKMGILIRIDGIMCNPAYGTTTGFYKPNLPK